MAAQGLALGRGHARGYLWHGLRLLRTIGIGVVAGCVAGFIAGGLGGRLAMKVVALLAGPGAQGRITENGSTIGVFTAERPFLLFFGAALGMIGGMLYVALRPWLPHSERWRGGVPIIPYGAGSLDFPTVVLDYGVSVIWRRASLSCE